MSDCMNFDMLEIYKFKFEIVTTLLLHLLDLNLLATSNGATFSVIQATNFNFGLFQIMDIGERRALLYSS